MLHGTFCHLDQFLLPQEIAPAWNSYKTWGCAVTQLFTCNTQSKKKSFCHTWNLTLEYLVNKFSSLQAYTFIILLFVFHCQCLLIMHCLFSSYGESCLYIKIKIKIKMFAVKLQLICSIIV